MKKFLILFITIAVLSIQVTMASTISSSTNKEEVEDNVYTAKEIYDAFKTDEKAANTKYGEKTITITGIATKVGPDVYTFPSIEISEVKSGNARALCVLPYSDYFELRNVEKGQEIFITGTIRRYSEKYDLIVIKECKIVER